MLLGKLRLIRVHWIFTLYKENIEIFLKESQHVVCIEWSLKTSFGEGPINIQEYWPLPSRWVFTELHWWLSMRTPSCLFFQDCLAIILGLYFRHGVASCDLHCSCRFSSSHTPRFYFFLIPAVPPSWLPYKNHVLNYHNCYCNINIAIVQKIIINTVTYCCITIATSQ